MCVSWEGGGWQEYSWLARGRILRRNPGKSLKIFPPCYSQSPLQLYVEIFFLSKVSQPLTVFTVQLLYTVKEKGGKPDRKPFPPPTLWVKNPYRNLKSENSQDYAQKTQWTCTFTDLEQSDSIGRRISDGYSLCLMERLVWYLERYIGTWFSEIHNYSKLQCVHDALTRNICTSAWSPDQNFFQSSEERWPDERTAMHTCTGQDFIVDVFTGKTWILKRSGAKMTKLSFSQFLFKEGTISPIH